MCCGPPKEAFRRTLKLAEADDIDSRSLKIEDQVNNATDEFRQNGIFISWNPPASPNAFIQKYEIEFYLENNAVRALAWWFPLWHDSSDSSSHSHFSTLPVTILYDATQR